ncbi:hypothetical protein DFH08DRAFT_918219 [Mycena albidolilacea]|uniref:Uncharacterized protein n=1 Tax=Mycena albidolilacea TaxID=1033008 RepID=A0AAD7ECN4_9AGAR|nr:hypothetical protein DFH08DRAFT_918219 [Mycena albidolilacea]
MFLLDTLDNLPRQRVSNSLMKDFLWILGEGGVPTVPWTSTQGNVFHLNDIRKIIAKDYANPLTRSLLHFYPEIPDGPVSEAWHAQKWRQEIDRDTLTPMIVDGHRHFYVNELARCRDGPFVIPLCWVLFKGEMHADAMVATVDGDGTAHTCSIIIWTCSSRNCFRMLGTPSSAAKYPSKMPNPLCKLAHGRPMYTSFVDLFFDDVSGNRSKSWNKHYNCYCTHRNLPRRILQQEFHTHFVTTCTEQEATVRVFVNTGPSDNPMGSNCFCRKCKVGGCGEHKRTDAGFHSMFDARVPRSAAETLTELHEQVELACLGVKAAVEARQTDTGVKDSYTNHWINDLLRRSCELKKADPNLDSAQIVQQLKDWVKQNRNPPHNSTWYSNYIMQFANSLIGRQFKQVAQTCIFHMHDLGELLPLLWYPEIDNMDQYLVDVETAISNILDIFAALDPTKILAKNKLHILTHAKADILRHESYECFNAIFRFCSILSNHLAPSRDIAHQLAHQEGWLSSSTGNWECAG